MGARLSAGFQRPHVVSSAQSQWVFISVCHSPSAPVVVSPSFHPPTMANPPRRIPPTNSSQYYAVPQSPPSRGGSSSYNQQPFPASSHPVRSSSTNSQPPRMQQGRAGDVAQGVASGSIGAGYGPYAVRSSFSPFILHYSLSAV